jgi:hypothetical protein
MIKKLKIGSLTFKFVFRHKWDNLESDRVFHRLSWKTKELGIFFRKDMCVGIDTTGRKMFNVSNLMPSYLLGFNLIWCKLWFELDWKVLRFE